MINYTLLGMAPQSSSSLEEAWNMLSPKPIGVLSHLVDVRKFIDLEILGEIS